jgi:Fe-S oxidoreductase
MATYGTSLRPSRSIRFDATTGVRGWVSCDAPGTSIVVTDNPGCVPHLRDAADASRRRNLRLQHLAEVLAARL